MKKHCNLEHLEECLSCNNYHKCFTITKQELKKIITKKYEITQEEIKDTIYLISSIIYQPEINIKIGNYITALRIINMLEDKLK